ncbi:mechanosensitive ion channel family protein [Synergistaceae bacterium OttesenSCG-928-D05]|nr:mechanosensitive ion channel family protein [Synergistaceae bacterium OttesenSCG-928-D05]
MNETIKQILGHLQNFYWIIKPAALLVSWLIADKLATRLVRRLCRATTNRIRNKVQDHQTQKTMLYRAQTICQLSTQTARGFVAVVMGFWLLDSVGLDMRPVIAGVGIVGLGLSLAAQNIIRDYLNGFLILFEDQYNVGDTITTNSYTGTVEHFSLRATKIRDISGSLITIPNSLIQTVSNANKNWSAAIVDLGIAYEADYKKAMELAQEVADALMSDPANMIIDKPAVQGINSFGDNAVGLRIIIKTNAGQQWAVGRLFRAKIKDAFETQGIALAYPKLVIDANKTERNEDFGK